MHHQSHVIGTEAGAFQETSNSVVVVVVDSIAAVVTVVVAVVVVVVDSNVAAAAAAVEIGGAVGGAVDSTVDSAVDVGIAGAAAGIIEDLAGDTVSPAGIVLAAAAAAVGDNVVVVAVSPSDIFAYLVDDADDTAVVAAVPYPVALVLDPFAYGTPPRVRASIPTRLEDHH